MTTVRRPRVATIGLDDTQVASIASLCGDLRAASLLDDYLENYDWTETDVMMSSGHQEPIVETNANPMTWRTQSGRQFVALARPE